MRLHLPVLLAAAILPAAPALAQSDDDASAAQVLEEPAAPSALKLVESAPRARPSRPSVHLELGHSDLSLQIGEYFAAVGMQVAATLFVTYVCGFIALTSQQNMTRNSFNEMVGWMTVITPVVTAIPSSLLAHKISKRCPGKDHPLGYTLIAGMLTSAAVNWGAAILATGNFGRVPVNHTGGAVLLFFAGALLPPLAEVLTLNLGATEVTAAPMMLKDGAGAAVGMRF
ncbi:MAG: hypothetical protein QM765_15650 [Myxococcales bacterium]